MEQVRPYAEVALEAIKAAGVPRAIGHDSRDVVILERLARAAGSTNWYVLHDADQLRGLAARLSPGSSISFYFDGRLGFHDNGAGVVHELLGIAGRYHDAVVGRLSPDGMTLEVDFIASKSELDAFTREISPGDRILYGAFPARDNDGNHAITIDLPDRDGIVRQHPH
jgi:hypothetical protein